MPCKNHSPDNQVLLDESLRLRILLYAYQKYPEPVSMTKMAEDMGSDRGNVRGAILGRAGRFSMDKALIAMGYLSEVAGKKTRSKLFTLTEKGLQYAELRKKKPGEGNIVEETA